MSDDFKYPQGGDISDWRYREKIEECRSCQGSGYESIFEEINTFETCHICDGLGIEHEKCPTMICNRDGTIIHGHGLKNTGRSTELCRVCVGVGTVFIEEHQNIYGDSVGYKSIPYRPANKGCFPLLTILFLFLTYFFLF